MINSASQYLYVSGDLNLIRVDGGIMPLRANQYILRGEDMIFLFEAYCERFNTVAGIYTAGWGRPVGIRGTISRQFSRKLSIYEPDGSSLWNDMRYLANIGGMHTQFRYTQLRPDISHKTSFVEREEYGQQYDLFVDYFRRGLWNTEAPFSNVSRPSDYNYQLRREPIIASFNNLTLTTRFGNTCESWYTHGQTYIEDDQGGAAVSKDTSGIVNQFWGHLWEGKWLRNSSTLNYEWGWYKRHVKSDTGRNLCFGSLIPGTMVHLYASGTANETIRVGSSSDEIVRTFDVQLYVGSKTAGSDGLATFVEADILTALDNLMIAKLRDGTVKLRDPSTPVGAGTQADHNGRRRSILNCHPGTLWAIIELSNHTRWW